MFHIFRQSKGKKSPLWSAVNDFVCACTFQANAPLPVLTQQRQRQLLLLWPRDRWKQTRGKGKWMRTACRRKSVHSWDRITSFCWHWIKVSFTAALFKTAPLPSRVTASSRTPDTDVRPCVSVEVGLRITADAITLTLALYREALQPARHSRAPLRPGREQNGSNDEVPTSLVELPRLQSSVFLISSSPHVRSSHRHHLLLLEAWSSHDIPLAQSVLSAQSVVSAFVYQSVKLQWHH